MCVCIYVYVICVIYANIYNMKCALCVYDMHTHTQTHGENTLLIGTKIQEKSDQWLRELRLELTLKVGKYIIQDNLSVIGKESAGTLGHILLPSIRKGRQCEAPIPYSNQVSGFVVLRGATIMDSWTSYL